MQSYYQALMTNKLTLIQFYTDVSTMTYGNLIINIFFYKGGEPHRGLNQIKDKLESLGFTKIVYKIDDMDV